MTTEATAFITIAAPFVEPGLADGVSRTDGGPRSPACPTDQVRGLKAHGAGFWRGCHGVLDRTTDGVDPQNAQPALHCDRGRDAADAVWRAGSWWRTPRPRTDQA